MTQETQKECIFRPRATPSLNIPLGARSVGHYRLYRQEGYDRPMVKHFVQVFWGVQGCGIFLLNGQERVFRPEELTLYLPGMIHDFWALDDYWEFRWWTMDGPLALEITRQFGLAAEIYKAGPAPVALFEELKGAILDLSPDGERNASGVAYRLLTRAAASGRAEPHDPIIAEALRIIHWKQARPDLNVASIARDLHIHHSTLSRRFKQSIGISPLDYITRLRVQNAMSLLKQSSLSVAEIGRQVGYDDPNYFSRLIRRHTRLSPLQFRAK